MLRCLLALLALPLLAQDSKTIVKDEAAHKLLLGDHKLTLQWLDKPAGTLKVTEKNGTLAVTGKQEEPGGKGFLRIDGIVTEIGPKSFNFRGTIVTQVSYIHAGKPCERKGEFHFLIKGPRAFWRIQEIDNPCDEAADYVDIYWK
ncbi:MAG: hypothetical protein ABI823_04185 [Bryobacteraceae bacterium]